MEPTTWYLGPLGDLRPLASPDDGVSRSVERFGGIHQALSGARTMDVTGHRATYELKVPWLTPEESRFLEALHYRTVPGPFFLIDPMATNRLPRPAAALLEQPGGITTSGGETTRSRDAPTAVGVPVTALNWSKIPAESSLTLPAVPLIGAETVSVSVWARSDQEADLDLSVVFLGVDADPVIVVETRTLRAAWRRYSLTTRAPDDAVSARVSFSPSGGDHTALAAAQFEAASEPTEWDTGGGAPMVVLDQLERTSPNFPRNDFTVTLLEV